MVENWNYPMMKFDVNTNQLKKIITNANKNIRVKPTRELLSFLGLSYFYKND